MKGDCGTSDKCQQGRDVSWSQRPSASRPHTLSWMAARGTGLWRRQLPMTVSLPVHAACALNCISLASSQSILIYVKISPPPPLKPIELIRNLLSDILIKCNLFLHSSSGRKFLADPGRGKLLLQDSMDVWISLPGSLSQTPPIVRACEKHISS